MSRGIVPVLALILSASLATSLLPRAAHAAGGESGASAAAATPKGLPIEKTADGIGRVQLSEAEWKKRLTPEQYRVLREKGTEIAFTGKYWNEHARGVYRCAACGLELFSSDTKFESGTGWPSFWQPIAPNRVHVTSDNSLGMVRDEVTCPRCGGHLGHVFDDGPQPTGLRYCMNSVSLEFVPAKTPAH